MIKQFMEAVRRKGKVYEKEQIKLRNVNRIKFCLNCNEFVKIVMYGPDGFCERCEEKLFTIRNNEKRSDDRRILNRIERR